MYPRPHSFYHGAVETGWNSRYGGLSLGLFIFTPGKADSEYRSAVRVHEYGHCVQSFI
ncbi:MAG: hypothetical protein J6M17_12840 [Ruminococcus sp.]|nr:hypothetical protein [Ruminococcus sp.]